MKRQITFSILVLSLALLCGCGSGSPSGAPAAAVPVITPAPVPAKAVASATVTADYRQGDPSGEYLVDVTVHTTAGEEIALEYCDTPIKAGDLVDLVPYQVGTTLVFVNEVLVGSVIDWPATEAQIASPDPEKEAVAWAAWEKWKAAHYAGEVDQ